jgi:regulator of protease activity HflC (stomatin/prohibitin superfamily)
MAIGIIVGLLLVIFTGVAIWGAVACYDNGSTGGSIAIGIIAALLILSFIVVPFSFHTVETGELAVVRTLGRITGVRDAGTNFDLWFINSYTKYDTKVQNVDIVTAAYSSDAQTMDISMTLQYQIMPDKVVDIATQYGSLEILQSRIQSIAIEKTKAVLSSHKAMDIIAKRASISPEVEDAIKEAVGADYYVKVNTVVLSNIDFSDAFELAVEEKMIAEQAKLKADYENEKQVAAAEAEAEAQLKRAEAAIEIAKAEAEAKKIAAEGEAAANKIITESITQELLDKILAERWDGVLPGTYVGDGDGLSLILPN